MSAAHPQRAAADAAAGLGTARSLGRMAQNALAGTPLLTMHRPRASQPSPGPGRHLWVSTEAQPGVEEGHELGAIWAAGRSRPNGMAARLNLTESRGEEGGRSAYSSSGSRVIRRVTGAARFS